MTSTAKPKIVSAAEWRQARDELLKAEKEATRTLDAIAARRRRLPMVKFDDYTFETPDGTTTLRDLFGDHVQLAVYQFMDNGPDEFCPGCTWFTNNVVNLDGLAENGVGVGDRLQHADRPDRGVQGEDGLDDAVRVVARHDVLRRLRHRGVLRVQHVLPRRGGRLPDLLHQGPRR